MTTPSQYVEGYYVAGKRSQPRSADVHDPVTAQAHGKLRDPGTGYSVILSVPYTLVGGGNIVRYTPNSGYGGPDSFTWKANDGGFDSNIATDSITVGGPQAVYSFPLNCQSRLDYHGTMGLGTPPESAAAPAQ